MRSPRRTGMFLGTLLLGLIGVMVARPSPASRVQPGRAPDFAILFTGDVVGYIEPCG